MATDDCVKFTVLDGLTEGFDVRVITDGCRAVNLQPGDDQGAFQTIRSAGAQLVTSGDLLNTIVSPVETVSNDS